MFRHALAVVVAAVIVLLAPAASAAGALMVGDAELPLERTDVDLDVAGSIASATVTQRFKNTYGKPIEVVYVFPLPQRAAVDAMEMKIGTRTITGSIARRDVAKQVYAAAMRDGRRAAMLEQERPNMFTFSVANIDPGATIDVKLHYFEVASFDHGVYELAVPTTIGPRHIPSSGVADADRITPAYTHAGSKLGLHARIDGGTPLESVQTPGWDTAVTHPSASVTDLKTKNDDIPNRDFVLKWKLKAESFEPAFFTHKASADSSGYLTLMLEPKHDIATAEIAPRELVFLLDTSGSMHGAPLSAAVLAVNRAIDKLGPNDTFQIIDFADRASTFAPRPLPNTAANRQKGHDYVNHLSASGGTNQLVGIHAALSSPGDDSRTRYVVFMTDGFIGNDADVIALTRREIGNAHIFSFGVGQSVNRYLLDEVAIAGRGYAEYMGTNQDANELVERFYNRIGLPFFTNIEIDWNGLAVADVRPAALPDLTALQPLILHARYTKPGEGDITIRGRVGGKLRTQRLHVLLPASEPAHAAIEKLWARETIAGMERVPRTERIDIEGITSVAVAHGLLSKYTAFVGTDSTGPANANASGTAMRIEQPSEAPDGVDLARAGGEYHGAPSTAPAPPIEESYAMVEAAPRHGGCAGCTTAPKTSGRPALAALALLAFTVIARRRRR